MNEMMYYDLIGSAALATSLPSQAARELGRRVVSGACSSGSLIEDEGALATRYNVSRTVIREAVRILNSKGLLDVRRFETQHENHQDHQPCPAIRFARGTGLLAAILRQAQRASGRSRDR